MKLLSISTLVLFSFVSCNHNYRHSYEYALMAPSDSEITLVINSLLKLEYDNPNTKKLCKPLFVLDTVLDRRPYLLSSCMYYQKDSSNLRFIGKNIFSSNDSLFSIWQIENSKPYKIHLNFDGVKLIGQSEFEKLEFYPRYYHNGCSIYRMTIPLFSVDKKTALIEVATFDRSGSGGTVVVMRKYKDKWIRKADFLSWASCK